MSRAVVLPPVSAVIDVRDWDARAQELGGAGYSLLALCGWTTIYALRAVTEERHLLLLDNGYAQYMQRVKWRFIPRVI